MVLIRPALLATFIAASATSVAYAAPTGTIVPLAAAPVQATLVQYGYGPRPYGAYGYRRYRFGASTVLWNWISRARHGDRRPGRWAAEPQLGRRRSSGPPMPRR